MLSFLERAYYHLSAPFYMIGLFVLACLLFLYIESKRKKRHKRKLSTIISEPMKVVAWGKISRKLPLYYCPTCFLLMSFPCNCPNHDYPVPVVEGSYGILNTYAEKQRLTCTEKPDDDPRLRT